MSDKRDPAADEEKPVERPTRPDGPWRHQDGCTNPNSTDWNCPCGPEVIATDD